MPFLSLGWTQKDADLPPAFESTDFADFRMVSIADQAATTPRLRAEAQLALFDAGHNLVPIAPGWMVSASDACRISRPGAAEISAALACLKGKAQLSFQLSHDAPLPPLRQVSGGWLRQRQAARESCQRRRQLLEEMADRVIDALPVLELAEPDGQSGDGLVRHVLVRTETHTDIRRQLRAAIDRHQGPNLRLDVCGPWPAYAFAPALLPKTTRSAA